jgi:hypothetical protein
MGDPQINSFQMLIGNLRGLDFGFGPLAADSMRPFSKLTWGTLTVPRLPKVQRQPE